MTVKHLLVATALAVAVTGISSPVLARSPAAEQVLPLKPTPKAAKPRKAKVMKKGAKDSKKGPSVAKPAQPALKKRPKGATD